MIAPAVYGGKLRRILAYVDRQKLEAHGFSLIDVQQALLKQNVLIPAGSIKIGRQELQIFTNANVEHVEQLNDVPIKMAGGVPVLMRDVGRVARRKQSADNRQPATSPDATRRPESRTPRSPHPVGRL